jgi:hypothetical protein
VRAQFVQHAPHHVQVKLEVDPSRYDPRRHAAIVQQEVRDRLGEAVRVEVDVVPEIERAHSGKFRMVLNLCGEGVPAGAAGGGEVR